MANSFDEILEAMMEAYEKNPTITQEELIKQAIPEADAEDLQKAVEEATEAGEYLEQFHEATLELEAAKEEGYSRAQWMQGQIKAMTPDWKEEERVGFAEAINQALEEHITNTISEEE